MIVAPARIGEVDSRTIAAGTPGLTLMKRAAHACVRVIEGRWSRRPVVVLAGPGNNGGDGWAIADELKRDGWPVTLYSDWPVEKLSGDAKLAASQSRLTPLPLAQADFSEAPLVVDALFGAGLGRDIEGHARQVVERLAASGAPVLAVDLPSGLDGLTGVVRGTAARAEASVTFGCAKPGHLIGDGKALCGDLHVMPIGLDLRAEDVCALWNGPGLWQAALPYPPLADHKYARGGLLVIGGPRHAGGAARLAARAGAVTGAGATTIAVSPSAADIYAAHLDAIMLKSCRGTEEFAALASSPKIAAVAVGPGLGIGEDENALLEAVLASGKPAVIDADALTLLSRRENPFAGLPAKSVLTPHEGEFARLFPDIGGSALVRAQAAAERAGVTVLLKGAVTVIATPGELPVLSSHASPWLATAGSGDVLTGIIAGLLAQEVSPRLSAAAGAWIHGDAAKGLGAGLTADNLSVEISTVLARLSQA